PASAAAIPVESKSEFGMPVKTTQCRSKPIWPRNFSPSSLALASSSSVIVVCAEPSIGTDLSLVYGPIQFHWPSLADLNMGGSPSGKTKIAPKQTPRGKRWNNILCTSPPNKDPCPPYTLTSPAPTP